MKKRATLITTFLLMFIILNAIFIEVGTGTERTNSIPVSGDMDFSWSRTIYLQSELINEMEIYTISYKVDNSLVNYVMNNQTIYMRHTTASSMTAPQYIDPETTPACELVFSGEITYNGGWVDITLDTSFQYNGTDNLEILFNNYDGSAGSSYPFFTSTRVVPVRAIYNDRNNNFPVSNGSTDTILPNMRFHFTAENEPGMPILTGPGNCSFNVDSQVDLTWANGEDTDWVKVYCSSVVEEVATMNGNALLANNYFGQSYLVDDIDPLTTYYWKIVSENSISEYLFSSSIWSFTTGSFDDIITIGNGQEIYTSLPFDPGFYNTLSQSIYDQEWFDVSDQRIEQISYYYNGETACTYPNIKLYLCHTELEEFTGNYSWVPLDNLVLCYDGPLSVPSEPGWVTIHLTYPFIYNNVDNLVVGFDSNFTQSETNNNDFYSTATIETKSILTRGFANNYEFANLPWGSPNSYIANVKFILGDIPTTPQLQVYPQEYSWNNTNINTSGNTVTFLLSNAGLSPLNVNSVSLDQDVNFILTDVNTYPLTIDNEFAEFTVTFHPLTDGNFTTNLTINDSANGDTVIPLFGIGYDAIIYDFPHYEGFEGVTWGGIPQDWSEINNTPNILGSVGVHGNSTSEGSRALQISNATRPGAEVLAITPPISNVTSKRVTFDARSQHIRSDLIIGVCNSNINSDDLIELRTINLTTEFQEYSVSLNVEDENVQFICFKVNFPLESVNSTYIDNVIIEEMPNAPMISVSHLEWDYPDTIIDSTSTANFVIGNIGLGELIIESIVLEQNSGFNFVDNNVYPLHLTSQTIALDVEFNPLIEAEFDASIIITDNEGNETTISLTGIGYDSTITEFPYFEGFEEYEEYAIPTNWVSSVNYDSYYSRIEVKSGEPNEGFAYPYAGGRYLTFWRSSSFEGETSAITPPIDNLTARRIRFRCRTNESASTLIIGTATSNSGDINFTACDTLHLTSDYVHYSHEFGTVTEDDKFIVFKLIPNPGETSRSQIDNLYFESIPTGPSMIIAKPTIDFGRIFSNRLGVGAINVQNLGHAPLEIDFTQVGYNFTFIPNGTTIQSNENKLVIVYFNPNTLGEQTGSFDVLSNDPLCPVTTINTTAYILPDLPDGSAIIGGGELLDQNLPFNPQKDNSFSQTLYYPSEIGFVEQRIERIGWYYDYIRPSGPDEFKVYMGHTDQFEFAQNSDWVDISELTEVYDGFFSLSGEEGWTELTLDIPFIYDGSQNLVVGVYYIDSHDDPYTRNFRSTASNINRSILFSSGTEIPFPVEPLTSVDILDSFPNVTLGFGDMVEGSELTVRPITDFGLVHVDETSLEQQVRCISTGSQSVTIATPPTITGTNANEFSITTDNNTYPLVLPINEIASLGVSFTPTSEGYKNAIIEVIDDATRMIHTVSLSGYAYYIAGDANDTPDHASILNLPVYGETYSIMPIDDIDWYKIPAMNTGDSLSVLIEDTGITSVNASMWLYGPVLDPSDIEIDSYLASGTDFGYTLPGYGDYYLRVAKSNVTPRGMNSPHAIKSDSAKVDKLARTDTGLYTLYVDAVYQAGFNSPLALEANNQAGYIELTWVSPPFGRSLAGYNISRDGEIVTDELIPVGTNLYHDEEVIVGTAYSYSVVGVYQDPDGLSQSSNSVTIIYFNPETPLWADDFEAHPDFTLDMPNWIQHDEDGGNTYTISDVDFANSGEAMSYIVFNPTATTPPITDMEAQNGDKFLASFASLDGYNNDWIITPSITLGATTLISFYARSYSADYGLERFRVLSSTGGSEISDFQNSLHHWIDYLEAPAEWTLYSFDVSDLTYPIIRFAIQCVSSDAFMFMIDDFRIDSTADAVDNESVEIIPQTNILSQNYPNPFNPETSISFSMKEAGNVLIDVYNIKGQKVKTLLNEYRVAGNHNVVWVGTDDKNQRVASGVYLYKMRNGTFSSTKKMILMK